MLKSLLYRLTFFIYECNLRVIGKYSEDDNSLTGNYHRHYLVFGSRLQLMSVIAFNTGVWVKLLTRIIRIAISNDILILGSIGVAFLIAQYCISDTSFSLFIKEERQISTKQRIIHHLITLSLFYILPVILLFIMLDILS